MAFTDEQEMAIQRNGNILVSAAAGSGKTAILVERTIRNILENGFNIDELLVVTFTDASAKEMKERIMKAVYDKLEKNPDDVHLQKQVLLLSSSNISTIHSFCFKILKEYFYISGILPNSKIGSTEQVNLLKSESINFVFNKLYEENNIEFVDFVKNFSGYINDDKAKEIIDSVYTFLRTVPFRMKWQKKVLDNIETDFESYDKTFYGKIYFTDLKEKINDLVLRLKKQIEKIYNSNIYSDELKEAFLKIFNSDRDNVGILLKSESWDNLYEKVLTFKSDRWSGFTKNIKEEFAEEIEKEKAIRDLLIDELKKEVLEKVYINSFEIRKENIYIKKYLTIIFDIVEKVDIKFNELKKLNEIVDFTDLEEKMCYLLVREINEDDKEKIKKGEIPEEDLIFDEYIKTDVGKSVAKKFKEVVIDEYQDINKMQEMVLRGVSRKNVFQVGDVKQSIYRFRNACPDLFLEKYGTFQEQFVNDEKSNLEKKKLIKLFKNFRSRREVLDFTNIVFKNIMNKESAELDYTEEEYLNVGFNYKESENIFKTEISLIYKEDKKDEDDIDLVLEEGKENLVEDLKGIEKEAKYISKRIHELIESKLEVFDKDLKGYRPIQYKDIAIILRSVKNKTEEIEKELVMSGIPVYSEEVKNYLSIVEVEKVISYLKVLNNPHDDIPFLSIMRSYFTSLNMSDILFINLVINILEPNNRKTYFEKAKMFVNIFDEYKENVELYGEKKKVYNLLKKYDRKEIVYESVKKILEEIERYIEEVKIYGPTYILKKIVIDSGYLDFVYLLENGDLKKENLLLLLNKAKDFEENRYITLLDFLQYLEKIKLIGTEEGVNIQSTNVNAVRIMTIHKSKGLEFPIVFLPNLNKKANKMDFNNEYLFDEKLGIALNYQDKENSLDEASMLKKVLILKKERELIAEEMRVLYVALTRAREKLILVSICDNDILEKIQEDISLNYVEGKISKSLIYKNNNYLYWILISMLIEKMNNPKDEYYILNEIKDFSNVSANEKKTVKSFKKIKTEKENYLDFIKKEPSSEAIKRIENILKLKQKKENENLDVQKTENNEKVLNIKRSTSATDISKDILKIKKDLNNICDINIKENEKINDIIYNNIEIIKGSRLFNNQENIGIDYGILIHKVFSLLNFKEKYTEEKVTEFLDELEKNEIITKTERNMINIKNVLEFVSSDILKEISNSEKIYKEEKFYVSLNKKEIIDILNEYGIVTSNIHISDEIEVNGFMDLCVNLDNNTYIVVDYKTDNVKNIEELKELYFVQLKIYEKAVKKIFNAKTVETYIYSVNLGKFIKI